MVVECTFRCVYLATVGIGHGYRTLLRCDIYFLASVCGHPLKVNGRV